MKNKLQPFQKELLHKIEEILYTDWNPLGGDDVPRDEYDSYALQVFGMMERGYTVEDITNTLYSIETEGMGLVGDIENCKKVTERIVSASII